MNTNHLQFTIYSCTVSAMINGNVIHLLDRYGIYSGQRLSVAISHGGFRERTLYHMGIQSTDPEEFQWVLYLSESSIMTFDSKRGFQPLPPDMVIEPQFEKLMRVLSRI